MNTSNTPVWHTASTGNHQGLIVDDAGNNIAVVYDKAHAPIIASAPTLLSQRNELRGALEKLAGWFHTELVNGAFSPAEHLLSGCANELKGNIETARAALLNSKGDA